MRYWFSAAILAVTAVGCRNPDAEFNAELNRELTSVFASLQELVEKTQPGTVALPPLEEGGPPRELRLLSADPTDEEVAVYAKTIYDLVKDRHTFHHNDVFVRLVSRIPPGHIHVLGDYLGQYYFQQYIRNWVRPEDKDKVLAALPESPGLLAVLPYFPTTPEEVRGVILQLLENNPGASPWSLQMYYPILLDDDATREKLTRMAIEQPQLVAVGDLIAQYANSTDIFLQMWEYANAHGLEISWPLASRALGAGSVEALGEAIAIAWKPEEGKEYQKRNILEKAPFLKEQADPVAFFAAHGSDIVFNPESKKFECKENAQ